MTGSLLRTSKIVIQYNAEAIERLTPIKSVSSLSLRTGINSINFKTKRNMNIMFHLLHLIKELKSVKHFWRKYVV